MLGARESDLVAVRAPAGPAWQRILGEAWDARAAVLPIDHRLPRARVEELLRAARPTLIIDDDTTTRPADGIAIDPAVGLVIATSGSSSAPRLAELPHDAVRAAVDASIQRLGATAEDPWRSCLPLAHMGGLLVLLRAARLDAPLTFGAFEPGARYTSAVPTMLARALEAGMDLSGFEAILIGGDALDPALASRAPVVTTYGMTESCGGVVYDGTPLEGVDVRVVDDEIHLGGPTLMRGYRLDADATRAAFTDDGWLRTRDAGELVAGSLRVFGRLDDAINTGGEKVWPARVERALRDHPGVADVGVSSRPDPEWGQRVVAFVEPRDPADPPRLEELRDAARAHLAPFELPRELVIVDALPRSPIGKVLRRALTDRTSNVHPTVTDA